MVKTLTPLFLLMTLIITGSACSRRNTQDCVEDGKSYKTGESFQRNACTHCTCEADGQALCYVIDCMMPPCVDPVSSADQCCQTCPNGANCQTRDGTVISAGDTVILADGSTCACDASAPHWLWNSEAICTPTTPTTPTMPTTPTKPTAPFAPPATNASGSP